MTSSDKQRKKILFLITKSNWDEKRILGVRSAGGTSQEVACCVCSDNLNSFSVKSQDLASYFWSVRTEIVTRYTAAVSGRSAAPHYGVPNVWK